MLFTKSGDRKRAAMRAREDNAAAPIAAGARRELGMGRPGLEHTPESPTKTDDTSVGGAECGALSPTMAAVMGWMVSKPEGMGRG